MARPRQPLTDVLRKAIAESGLAQIAIERATGVKRASIMRFLRGERSLRLDMADRLAAYFGLELKASAGRKAAGKTKKG
jgi:plasmid maintenance system antidote protein VapI